jgi:hypothetical protein
MGGGVHGVCDTLRQQLALLYTAFHCIGHHIACLSTVLRLQGVEQRSKTVRAWQLCGSTGGGLAACQGDNSTAHIKAVPSAVHSVQL